MSNVIESKRSARAIHLDDDPGGRPKLFGGEITGARVAPGANEISPGIELVIVASALDDSAVGLLSGMLRLIRRQFVTV
jgi:hypothetical protein